MKRVHKLQKKLKVFESKKKKMKCLEMPTQNKKKKSEAKPI